VLLRSELQNSRHTFYSLVKTAQTGAAGNRRRSSVNVAKRAVGGSKIARHIASKQAIEDTSNDAGYTDMFPAA
jgi:hypothetical protein